MMRLDRQRREEVIKVVKKTQHSILCSWALINYLVTSLIVRYGSPTNPLMQKKGKRRLLLTTCIIT